MLPAADYERITQTIKTILDMKEASTAHACQCFALAGAAILATHYWILARPVFGAAFVVLDDTSRDTLAYGMVHNNEASSDEDHYHAWIDTGDYVIDFMAPLYGQAMRTKGYAKDVPSWMLQRQKSTISDNLINLRKQGDCYFSGNASLSTRMVEYYLKEPEYRDLMKMAVAWFHKPPQPMLPLQTMEVDGKIHSVPLDKVYVTGYW